MNRIQRTCSVGFFLLALFAGAGLCRADAADEWDATYVTMIVPKTVEADQTFAVAITMKNTGTRTWQFGEGNTPATLRSQSPEENETWGTKYIIQGQGTKVAPGQQFTFNSNLRAPSEAGKHVFEWRLSGKQGLFGEPTTKLEINVVARKEPAAGPPAIPAADADGKRPLTFNDFEYLGSFRVPVKVGKGGAGFSEGGLALRKLPDGTRHLLLNYTHPALELFEVEIPQLVKFENDNAKPLQTAAVKRQWGRIGNTSKKGPNDTKQKKGPNDTKQWGANGGIWWDEDRNTLYWTYYHGYWAGGQLPIFNATKLNDDGSETALGSWTAPHQKWHWGGVTRLPKSFADKYTGGETLALGFGGYFNICAPCSRGPALSVIADPDHKASAVSGLVNMISYTDPIAAPRPGNYFLANVGFWNTQPVSRAKGTWAMGDQCRAGVMIDLADKQGYVAFVRLGTGRLGYDYAAGTTAGWGQYWYFYDTRQMGAVAQGRSRSAALTPYIVQLDEGMKGLATGACFDEEERKLYLIRMQAYRLDREFHPLVHVYQVKK